MAGETLQIELPSLGELDARMGGGPATWAGNCHAVSTAVAELIGSDHATVRRGYFRGTVDPDTYFGQRGGVGQHSWVELRDGRVCDPSRFALKACPAWPLWVGPADEYDIGGCAGAAPAGSPPSPWDEDGRAPVALDLGSTDYVADLVGVPDEFRGDGYVELSMAQLVWLANLPVQDREQSGVLARFFAAEVFEAICNAGWSSLIPVDRRDWILPELSEGRSSF